MTFQPGYAAYTQGFGTAPAGVSFPFIGTAAPTSSSIQGNFGPFQIGQRWVVPNLGEWVLLNLSTSSGVTTATWEQIVSALGDVLSVTGTANQILASPTTGNVVLSLIGPYTPATYTAHGVLVGEGTSSIVATAAGTTGQVLTATTSADPAFAALGTNSGLTAHGVLLGENNSAIAATAAGTNGQVLLGSTGADPAFGTLTTTTGLAFTGGAASLAINVANGGYAVVDQTTSSATLAKQTSYVTDNGASLVTYTLPLAANAAQGNVYQVTGGSSGGWTIAQNASQTIHAGTQNTTTGTGGSISSNSRYASLTLQCINATGLDFVVIASSGTFTIV